ncbi:MAG: hypothetical protein IH605_21030 [Burkholderiales bacterium]|nr:hypothetical protein [Burkholderiales bacterium]
MQTLRNVGWLLALFVASQIAIVVLMTVTDLSYHDASSVTVASLFALGVILALWLVLRVRRTRALVSETMENVKKLQAEEKKMIPEFRDAANRLRDPKAKAEVLEQLAFIEHGSQSLPPSDSTVGAKDRNEDNDNL